MKIEICERSFWLAIWTIVSIAFVAIILGAQNYYKASNETFTKAGYTREMLPGASGANWVKK